ncbi:MAG: hypothetical protein AAFZ52_15055, partial [Bacteroidota bacterium]
LGALLDGGDSHLDFTGGFHRGQSVGTWRYVFGDYRASGTAEMKDLQYHLNVDGVRHQANGEIAEGRPHGKWIQEVRRIEESQPAELLFRSEIDFAAGVPQRSFRAEDSRAELLGRFKRNGLAHDVWTVYEDLDATENWYFIDGILRRIEILEPEDTTVIPVLEELPRETQTINADARYFRFLARWQQLAGRELPANRLRELLTANAVAYTKVTTVMKEVGEDNFRPVLGVRVPHFPLPAERIAQLTTLTDRLRHADTLATNLTENTSLSIIANTDDEVAYLLAVLRHLRSEFLAPVAELTAAYREEVLAFLPRKLYYERLWPQDVVPGTFTVHYGSPKNQRERTFSSPGAHAFAVRRDGLDAIVGLADYAVASMDSIRAVLGVKLNTKEQQRVLTALEDQFMSEYGRLDSLVGAQRSRLVKDYQLQHVTEAADRELQHYATLAGAGAKQQRAPALTACIQDLEALAIELIRLPERWEEIKELYTDEVWNNFTATVMEEELKKHLTEAYREQLIPYFLEQVTASLGCESAGALAGRIAQTNERMLFLRDADTDELENRIRTIEDPQAILNLINAGVQK